MRHMRNCVFVQVLRLLTKHVALTVSFLNFCSLTTAVLRNQRIDFWWTSPLSKTRLQNIIVVLQTQVKTERQLCLTSVCNALVSFCHKFSATNPKKVALRKNRWTVTLDESKFVSGHCSAIPGANFFSFDCTPSKCKSFQVQVVLKFCSLGLSPFYRSPTQLSHTTSCCGICVRLIQVAFSVVKLLF